MAAHIVSMPNINYAAAAASKINVTRSTQNPPPSEVVPKYVRDYRANSHKITEFFSALKARILATNLRATLELAALSSYLTEEALELARFHAQQSEMQAALQSLHGGMAAELDRVNARKKVFAVLFTLAAAASAAGAAIAAGVDDKRPAAAVAAAFATLFLALGKWIDSRLKMSEKGVKKHRDIIRRMIVSGKLTIEDLAEIIALARDMKAEAEAISKMVDEGGVEVGKKLVALNKSFKELQRKAIQGGLDASSAREVVLQSILTNLE